MTYNVFSGMLNPTQSINHISVQSCPSPSQCSTVVLTPLLRPAKPVQNGTTSEPVDIKFGMGDYIGDITPRATIQTNRPSGGIPAHE